MSRSIVLATNSIEFSNLKVDEIRESLAILKNNFSDQILITVPTDKMSIGIKQMQDLKDWSKTKPYSGANKLAVIMAAELMTSEAQNSVLKLLEEPNLGNNYVLVAGNYLKLLPTVLSRCELILDPNIKLANYDLSEFLQLDQLDKFKYLEHFEKYNSTAEKYQQVDLFLLALLQYFRARLSKDSQSSRAEEQGQGPHLSREPIANNLRTIQLVKKMCDAKVSTKNALDYLVINVKFS